MERLSESQEPNTTTIFSSKDEMHGFIRYPGTFKISKEYLAKLVDEYNHRTFTEEIERLESIGGDESIQNGLVTNLASGIAMSPPEILFQRKEEYGENRNLQSEGFLRILVKTLKSYFCNWLFILAALVLLLDLGSCEESRAMRKPAWIDSGSVVMVSVIGCLFGIYQKYKEEKLKQMKRSLEKSEMYTVRRDGKILDLYSSELLVGDLVHIVVGMVIPADGYVFKSSNCYCDESSITGDARNREKQSLKSCLERRDSIINDGYRDKAGKYDVPSPIILSGSTVENGEADFIVTVVGNLSFHGKIIAAMEKPKDPSLLQRKIASLEMTLKRLGYLAAFIVFAFLGVRFVFERVQNSDLGLEHFNEIISYLLIEVFFIYEYRNFYTALIDKI